MKLLCSLNFLFYLQKFLTLESFFQLGYSRVIRELHCIHWPIPLKFLSITIDALLFIYTEVQNVSIDELE